MADERIIDKALALLPSGGAKKKRMSDHAARQKRLGVIQRKLAALSKHVEKLAATMAKDAKQAVSSKPAGGKPAAGKKPGMRTTAAKKPAARKPVARKDAGGGKRAAKG